MRGEDRPAQPGVGEAAERQPPLRAPPVPPRVGVVPAVGASSSPGAPGLRHGRGALPAEAEAEAEGGAEGGALLTRPPWAGGRGWELEGAGRSSVPGRGGGGNRAGPAAPARRTSRGAERVAAARREHAQERPPRLVPARAGARAAAEERGGAPYRAVPYLAPARS